MTLQASGAISLGNIQTEFTGSNPISMSEYRRGAGSPILVPDTATNANIKSTLSNMSFSNYYNTSVVSVLDTQSLYVGLATSSYTSEGTTFYRYAYGFRTTVVVPTGGSLSDGTSNIYSGASILAIVVDWDITGTLQFRVNGSVSNAGWTTITVNGTTYNRTSATYSTGGGFTNWLWDLGTSLGPLDGYVNTTVTVTWN